MKRIFIISTIILGACSTSRVTNTDSNSGVGTVINGKIFTTAFQQRAAEYKALCFQAYNIAQFRLDQYKPSGGKPVAIITDIDETVLDNSAYEAHQTLQGKDYDPASWKTWTDMSAADTVPGAVSFLKYAASKGVEIFYITNRAEQEKAGTLKNLQQFGLPNADDAHLLPKQNTSSKETRRLQVMGSHEVIMLIGDNLADFSDLFEKKQTDERLQNTINATNSFGNRFIVLPNAVYGDWEFSLYKYDHQLTTAQKDSVIRSSLKTY